MTPKKSMTDIVNDLASRQSIAMPQSMQVITPPFCFAKATLSTGTDVLINVNQIQVLVLQPPRIMMQGGSPEPLHPDSAADLWKLLEDLSKPPAISYPADGVTSPVEEAKIGEGYGDWWWHAVIHLNPLTYEIHSDADRDGRMRQWFIKHIQDYPSELKR